MDEQGGGGVHGVPEVRNLFVFKGFCCQGVQERSVFCVDFALFFAGIRSFLRWFSPLLSRLAQLIPRPLLIFYGYSETGNKNWMALWGDSTRFGTVPFLGVFCG